MGRNEQDVVSMLVAQPCESAVDSGRVVARHPQGCALGAVPQEIQCQ